MRAWYQRYYYTRPEEKQVSVERAPVAGAVCPACGSTDVRRYPVATDHGARMTVTCQACLHRIRVERPSPEDEWPPFRSVTYDWEASPAERATRELQMQRQEAGS